MFLFEKYLLLYIHLKRIIQEVACFPCPEFLFSIFVSFFIFFHNIHFTLIGRMIIIVIKLPVVFSSVPLLFFLHVVFICFARTVKDSFQYINISVWLLSRKRHNNDMMMTSPKNKRTYSSVHWLNRSLTSFRTELTQSPASQWTLMNNKGSASIITRQCIFRYLDICKE